MQRVLVLQLGEQALLLRAGDQGGIVGKVCPLVTAYAVFLFITGDKQRPWCDGVPGIPIGEGTASTDKVVDLERTFLMAVYPLVLQQFLFFMHLIDKDRIKNFHKSIIHMLFQSCLWLYSLLCWMLYQGRRHLYANCCRNRHWNPEYQSALL